MKPNFTLIQGTLIVTLNEKSYPFARAPLAVADWLTESLHHNAQAKTALKKMGINDPQKQLEKYASCRFACNSDCPVASSCPHRGRLCIDRRSPDLSQLTPRDIRILRELAHGLTPATVAQRFFTTESNIRRIVARVKHTYAINTHAHLGAWAVHNLNA
jgi:DNA-binding CsgD family transcriptional regulator